MKTQVNPYFSGSYVGKTDTYNCINYNDFYIDVWEFKNTEIKSIKDIRFNPQMDLEKKVEISSGQRINPSSILK